MRNDSESLRAGRSETNMGHALEIFYHDPSS